MFPLQVQKLLLMLNYTKPYEEGAPQLQSAHLGTSTGVIYAYAEPKQMGD